jgi:RHS repeat-associated protein
LVQQNTGTLQKIIWHRTPTVKDENIFENTVTEATNTMYDIDGNVTHSNIIHYAKTGPTFLREVARVFTVSIYDIFGSFRKNVTTQITKTTTRSGQVAYSSVVNYTYNNLGQSLTKTDFSGQPKAVTQTYTYNALGNISGLTISAANLAPRSTSNIYDTKGRYIISSTNAAGQTSSATYDARWAKPLTSIGVDGIKSKFEYDEFGRLKKTFYRKDLTDEFSTTLAYFWGPYGTSFYTLYSHPGKPDVKTYFDNLGRKIIQETEGFQGHWIKESYAYDGNGNIIFHNGPHRPTAGESSGLGTTSVFDDYGRLKTVTNSLRTIEYTYDYTAGEKKVTQTLDLPVGQTDQVSSQTTDVTGKVISTTDALGTLGFRYFSHGQIRDVKRGTTTYSSMLYDIYARQTRLTDINSGITTYEYNAYGELFKENQPSGNNLTYLYNTLGNITARSGTEGTTSYTYHTTGVKINKLEKVTSFTAGYEESFAYDNVYSKLQSKTEKINNTNFVTSFTYNKYDDLLTTTYPSTVVVTNEYDANGYLTNVKNGSTTLFTNQGMTAYNNYKTYQYGNGLITDVTYHFTIPTRFYARNSNASIQRQDLNLNWNYGTGNLNSRTDAIVNKTETFQYDIMNRLTSAQVGSNIALTMNYSADGNMTVKSDAAGIGGLEYLDPKINAISKVQNPISVPYGLQSITYDVYQRPTMITEGIKSLDLSYSYDYERRMGVFKTSGVTDETRWYVGNYEKQTIGSTTSEIHYVSNGERLIAMIVKTGSTVTNYYVHTDHLGSIVAITNSSMAYETRQNYDPWGRKRNVDNWTYSSVQSVPTWLYRGFTGHEEYPQFNLINMNARLYDHTTGRMLSPDIAITMPYSSQGYNRYSYANNNPLKYIDPDGNEPITLTVLLVAAVKGAAIGVAMNGISNFIQEKNFFDGWARAAVIGGVSGGISSAIGSAAGNMVGATKLEISMFQGFHHGFSGALFNMMQGGNPATGFVSGFASSVTASSIQSLGGGKIAPLIGGTLSGGVGTAVVGGDFYQGATFGLISTSLNHLAEHVSKPLFSLLKKNYPKYGPQYQNGGTSDDDFAKMAGGKVELNIKNGTFTNTCALRVCFALTISGVALPYISGSGNSSSMNGNNWLYPRVEVLAKTLNKLYGDASSISNVNQLKGQQGIIIFHTGGMYGDARGHASLWDGNQVLGGNHDYLPLLGSKVSASFWAFK